MPPNLEAKMFMALKVFLSNPYTFFDLTCARKELYERECTFFLRFVNLLNHVWL